MKNLLYLILLTGIIPATWMCCLTIFGIFAILDNAEFSLEFFLWISSMILGVCGYIGLLILWKGLHQTEHLKKMMLLFSGLLGFSIFMIRISPRNIIDWFFDSNLTSLIGKLPIIVTIVFLILTAIDFLKIKILVKDN